MARQSQNMAISIQRTSYDVLVLAVDHETCRQKSIKHTKIYFNLLSIDNETVNSLMCSIKIAHATLS